MILQACFLEEKPETFSCAWWRAFMNLSGPLGWAFSLANNEQMSNKVGERSIRKSHFLRRKVETYTSQPQQNGQFRAFFCWENKEGRHHRQNYWPPPRMNPRRGGGGPAHWRCGMPHQPTWTPCGCMHQRRRVWKGAGEGKRTEKRPGIWEAETAFFKFQAVCFRWFLQQIGCS